MVSRRRKDEKAEEPAAPSILQRLVEEQESRPRCMPAPRGELRNSFDEGDSPSCVLPDGCIDNLIPGFTFDEEPTAVAAAPKMADPIDPRLEAVRALPFEPLRDGEPELLEEFRDRLQAQDMPLPDEWTLVRFLRARGKPDARDLEASLEMYCSHLEWREQFGTDDIADFNFHEVEEVYKMYPVGFFNTTKTGQPVYVQRLGNLNVKQLLSKITTKERILQWHVQGYEEMLVTKLGACSEAKGQQVTQIFSIMDLKGCSAGMMLNGNTQSFLGSILSLDQDNYPEILYKMYIINAPGVFSAAWSVISRFLDKATCEKITISKKGCTKELLEMIDADKLPEFLGGTASSSGWPQRQPGPWGSWEAVPCATPRRVQQPAYVEFIEPIEPPVEMEPEAPVAAYNKKLVANDGLLVTTYNCRCPHALMKDAAPQSRPRSKSSGGPRLRKGSSAKITDGRQQTAQMGEEWAEVYTV